MSARERLLPSISEHAKDDVEMHDVSSRAEQGYLAGMTSRMRRLAGMLVGVSLAILFVAPTAQAEFGIVPDSYFAKNHETVTQPIVGAGTGVGPLPQEWNDEILDAPEVTQAGAHPDTTVGFRLNIDEDSPPSSPLPDENARDIIVDLPAGFVGNPQANPVCSAADFFTFASSSPIEYSGRCAPSSQIGLALTELNLGLLFNVRSPIYSIVPPQGVAARFGFKVVGFVILLDARVRSDGDYGLSIDIKQIPTFPPLNAATTTMWGVPQDSSHDQHRWNPDLTSYGLSSSLDRRPFLSTPTRCDSGDLPMNIRMRSWENPDVWVHDTDTASQPSGCESIGFGIPGAPVSAAALPTTNTADSPTGLEFKLELPYNDDPDGIARGTLEDAVVNLPEGMTVNPSTANGMDVCTPAEIGLDDTDPPSCSDASKLGSVEITTPLLEKPLKGFAYQAAQGDNPFDSTLAMYLQAEGQGVQIKLAGMIEPDPDTGKLTIRFDDNPPLPFTELVVRLAGGDRAALVTPSTCGTHQTVTELTPWSGGEPVSSTSSFEIDKGPDGGACLATTKAGRPFNPTISAGIQSPSASTYSPFNLRLTRPDGHQELSSFNLQMPQGVTAKLAGVASCPDATLAAISSAEGTGAAENATPSCPANSQIGKATVGVGAGSTPYYVQTGKAYLAGPYKGAQLSLAVVVPALAGPFDLGSTVVRSSLNVDPRTAQITVQTDPLPQILHGIPLKIRDLRVNVDREQFMLSPSNCDPMSVNATVQGSHGKSAALTNHFQVGDCASLGFSPKLKLDFGNSKKSTKRNQHPPLSANLAFNEGDANISSVQVALPEGVLLDQERIGKVCSREAYAASSCPAESQVGYAKATTPLLDNPVEGPVYLKASDNVLPDLAADLNGQIDIDLFGRIDQREGKKVSRIQNTFDVVPDVPVSDFELTLNGGDDGLLVNSKSICSSKRGQKVSIDMVAHNEMTLSENPLIGSACKSINKKKAKKLKKKAAKLLRKAKKADSKSKAKKLRKQARKLKKQARKLGR